MNGVRTFARTIDAVERLVAGGVDGPRAASRRLASASVSPVGGHAARLTAANRDDGRVVGAIAVGLVGADSRSRDQSARPVEPGHERDSAYGTDS